MSLKKILVLDGVVAVCRFRDDGVIRGIDDSSEQKTSLFGFLALADVARNAKLGD